LIGSGSVWICFVTGQGFGRAEAIANFHRNLTRTLQIIMAICATLVMREKERPESTWIRAFAFLAESDAIKRIFTAFWPQIRTLMFSDNSSYM
jgi:hypothetical protein